MIYRWDSTKHKLHDLYKWNFHPHYEFPLRLPTWNIDFDFNSGRTAKDNGNPNGCFQQLILDNRTTSTKSLFIQTDPNRNWMMEHPRWDVHWWEGPVSTRPDSTRPHTSPGA